MTPCRFTTIETEVFSECLELSDIKFPKGLVTIRSGCFYGCVSLTELNFHDLGGHFTITQQAFQLCTSLKTVIFETQPSMIFENCFYGCTSLESVTLKNVTLPKNGTTIDKYAFFNCTSLKYFEFDKWTFLKINDYSFYQCPLTESISFIGTVHPINFTISAYAFTSNVLKSIDFRNCSRLVLVKNAFACQNVNCVMIDEDRRKIAEVAFPDNVINGPNCPNHPTATQSEIPPSTLPSKTIEPTKEPSKTQLPSQSSFPTETLLPTQSMTQSDDDDESCGDSKISKKTVKIIVVASASALVLILVVAVVVVVVRRRRAAVADDINSKPLITEEDAPNKYK